MTITVTFPRDTLQHQTNYKRDWEGREFFYVIHKRQSGVKKITGDRIFLDATEALDYLFELGRLKLKAEDYEVRAMVCPYIDGPEP